jgi:hypothetical protein
VGAQQGFDPFEHSSDLAARETGLKLALQFNEGSIGIVEPPRKNRSHMKKCNRIFFE